MSIVTTTCPRCESTSVVQLPESIGFNQWHCNQCSHQWDFATAEERALEPDHLTGGRNGFRLRMQRLEDRWRRRLEAEAKECEHAVRTKSLGTVATFSTQDQSSFHSLSDSSLSDGRSPATWETIEISFLSDHRVQIFNGTNSETLNYAEFGFADGRNDNPNQAWDTMRTLAEQHGIIQDAMKTGQPWPKVEKRIQEIRKIMRKHFGISTDPIPFIKGTGYQARFKIGCSPSVHT